MNYGCIGEKLTHSFSKEIHEKIADYSYKLKEIKKEDLKDFILSKDFKGINVTIPYKKEVIQYLDVVDDMALKIGAVNTVVNKGGKLYGYNTDFFGLKELILKSGIEVIGKTTLILGSGGTSKTAFYVLKDLGAKEIIKISRRKSDTSITYEEAEKEYANKADIIVNTTPVGMYPNFESSPVCLEKYKNISGVIDVVYNPLETKLVADARRFGIKAENGLYMLVSQAVYAAGYFKGITPSNEITDKIYNSILKNKQNIVLTGMPGCGKTTVGKILAEITNKEFIDTDDIITKKYDHPSKLINEKGEKYFRDIETEVIKAFSLLNNKVIATGGGAVLKEENIEYLKLNSVIFFVDRNIDDITPTDDRPLSKDRELLKKVYNERIDIYNSTCDFKINANSKANETAEKIKELFYEN